MCLIVSGTSSPGLSELKSRKMVVVIVVIVTSVNFLVLMLVQIT